MNSAIVIKKFNLSIEGTKILTDINLELPKNQIIAIIGPSGCGKSTLLRSINRMNDLIEGLEYTGSITVDGDNILSPNTDVTEIRRKIGMIAQTPNPLPMSIYENVIYGPRIHGLKDKVKKDEIVKNSLERVGLWEEVSTRLDAPANKLSIGQQQRLCLARTIANDPNILLCDETTSALDPTSAKKIETELLELKKDYTILFVTHILRQARRIADYVVFIYFGEIVEHGPAEKIFGNPSDPRMKQYLEGSI
ncbi:phosphate ABC transporter ATP-binding protein [Methanogenium organophilum]|uniref:Phosphate ABC transporter ATP-binding protein n=1 Tax=Methanogenium organophilum TaxID=2199 RepID=A0A9X9S5D2_METOG|nr:phosphate ABC transporter ATP-binding protein [Methanogenium organophilum]WAI01220.1 phosphate ABC transporter ATP-binding protein [Methanogenium organophilum]